ncbi:MAG: DUF4488 domain-containing protein [Bacteroidaceae bacterium]|jgi:hypothetical protein|nr:DUF4488 domain-containing protein [Bacteroidaceae bacterium]
MKKFMFLLATVLLGATCEIKAQELQIDKRIEPLVGMWQYVEEVNTENGGKAYIGKQIFKTITEKMEYFVILGVNIPIKEANSNETQISTLSFITQQGEMEMRDNNTYLEYINNHYLDKSLNNTISNLRYRFSEENKNILYVEYNLGEEDSNWISEVWLRVMPLGAR